MKHNNVTTSFHSVKTGCRLQKLSRLSLHDAPNWCHCLYTNFGTSSMSYVYELLTKDIRLPVRVCMSGH